MERPFRPTRWYHNRALARDVFETLACLAMLLATLAVLGRLEWRSAEPADRPAPQRDEPPSKAKAAPPLAPPLSRATV